MQFSKLKVSVEKVCYWKRKITTNEHGLMLEIYIGFHSYEIVTFITSLRGASSACEKQVKRAGKHFLLQALTIVEKRRPI